MRYAAEDCPVNRMKDRDAGAWDAQALLLPSMENRSIALL